MEFRMSSYGLYKVIDLADNNPKLGGERMNLITILHRYPDQEACIEHLEHVRWGDQPFCPHCSSLDVARKAEKHRQGRWNCHDCKSSFNVLSKTVMQKTKVPLQKWFLAIGLIVNAKKNISSHQLARDLNLNQKTALFMQERIRASMASGEKRLLQDIVEEDEPHTGGKAREPDRRDDDTPNPGGRGTKEMPVLGAAEPGGKVGERYAHQPGALRGRGILPFISRTFIKHSKRYAVGNTHTNTIQGLWSLANWAWHGSHHKYSQVIRPLFLLEYCLKYNYRQDKNTFSSCSARIME